MPIRVAAVSALAALAWAGGLFAQTADAPASTVTGHVVSTGNTSIVVRTDDDRESPPLILTTTTQLPAALAAGDRVTVYYHAVGDRQVADRIVAATKAGVPAPEGRPSADRPTGGRGGPNAESEWDQGEAQDSDRSEQPRAPQGHGTTPAEPGHGMRPADDSPGRASQAVGTGPDDALPATASPVPMVGLAGLVALLGSIFLRASEGLRSR